MVARKAALLSAELAWEAAKSELQVQGEQKILDEQRARLQAAEEVAQQERAETAAAAAAAAARAVEETATTVAAEKQANEEKLMAELDAINTAAEERAMMEAEAAALEEALQEARNGELARE